jgi:hypothetical protein
MARGCIGQAEAVRWTEDPQSSTYAGLCLLCAIAHALIAIADKEPEPKESPHAR